MNHKKVKETMRKSLALFLFLFCFFPLAVCDAANITWFGTDDTNWANPGNWSGGEVPTADDEVSIVDGNNIVIGYGNLRIGMADTIGGNNYADRLNMTGGTLNILGGLLVSDIGRFTQSGGSITTVGDFIVGNVPSLGMGTADYTITGGTLRVPTLVVGGNIGGSMTVSESSGTTSITATRLIMGDGVNFAESELIINSGTFTVTGAGGHSLMGGPSSMGSVSTLTMTGGTFLFGTEVNAEFRVGGVSMGTDGTVDLRSGEFINQSTADFIVGNTSFSSSSEFKLN